MVSKIQGIKLKLIEELRKQNFDFNRRAAYLVPLKDQLVTVCLALHLYGPDSAEKISKKIGLPRAEVSDYCNQAERGGYVQRGNGRPVVFGIANKYQ